MSRDRIAGRLAQWRNVIVSVIGVLNLLLFVAGWSCMWALSITRPDEIVMDAVLQLGGWSLLFLVQGGFVWALVMIPFSIAWPSLTAWKWITPCFAVAMVGGLLLSMLGLFGVGSDLGSGLRAGIIAIVN